MTASDEIWVDMAQFDTHVADGLWDGTVYVPDAPPWYSEVTTLIHTARGPAEPDELVDEPLLVEDMHRTAVGSGPVSFRRHRHRRAVGRVVAMKAAAATTASVMTIAAAAAAATGIVATLATVVVPVIEDHVITTHKDTAATGFAPSSPSDAAVPSTTDLHARPHDGPPCASSARICPNPLAATDPSAVVEPTGSTVTATSQVAAQAVAPAPTDPATTQDTAISQPATDAAAAAPGGEPVAPAPTGRPTPADPVEPKAAPSHPPPPTHPVPPKAAVDPGVVERGAGHPAKPANPPAAEHRASPTKPANPVAAEHRASPDNPVAAAHRASRADRAPPSHAAAGRNPAAAGN